MTDNNGTGYGPYDLARYPLLNTSKEIPEIVRERCLWPPDAPWPARSGELLVVEAITQTCAVGYGGHYAEVLEDDTEGEVLRALADYLAPKFHLNWQRAYDMLEEIRVAYVTRLRAAMFESEAKWRSQGFIIDNPKGPDRCPICGTHINDHNEDEATGKETGCEAPDGQRWCIEHALDALISYREGKVV